MTVKTSTVNQQGKSTIAAQTFGETFKAGVIGGIAISALLLVYQISLPFLRIALIPAALIIVWIVTGIGAAMLAGNRLKTSRDSTQIGLIAGLISGTVQGITAMIISAFGLTFIPYGQGFLAQFSDTQIISLAEIGFTEQLITLSGSIFTAMFVCGGGGMFVSALLGGFGGWLYPKFNP